ncbi:MAG: cobalamin B12-binding domain-containing protein, partial [Deltaproteobacteria bacterium]|nr:cobalamin B12-binding domain-containing protein [Deltaproteobacteria bacterium]
MPDLTGHVKCIVSIEPRDNITSHNLITISPGELPTAVKNVFLCELLTEPRLQMRGRLPSSVNIVEPTILAEVAAEAIPARGWVPLPRNIYPIDLPQIQFKKGMDLILLDCPSRNLALMPNGLAYVNNALKKTSVSYQIFDLDIVAYHRFHLRRLFDMGGRITLPSGRVLPEDPWQAEHYDVWTMAAGSAGHNEILEFFRPLINETVARLVEARPKILGLSIQQCNEAISREIVRGLKAKRPETVILVGGFSCYNADIGLRAFPECDYMCMGEADLTVGPLVEALARGERPFNQAGVLSRFDKPEALFIPAPMVHDLDQIDFPKYEWSNLRLYRNYNDYQLTPIIASRGCRWSRCTFCAERFYWRIRSAQNFVDELQWLVDQGCYLYMFNES